MDFIDVLTHNSDAGERGTRPGFAPCGRCEVHPRRIQDGFMTLTHEIRAQVPAGVPKHSYMDR